MAPSKRPDVQEHASSLLNPGQPAYHDDPDDDATIAGPFENDALFGSGRSSMESAQLRLDSPQRETWATKLAARIPPGVKRAWNGTVAWTKGPDPPRIFRITPFFPQIQHAPLALLDRFAPKKTHRFWLLMCLYACWLLSFSLLLRASSFAAEIPGYGKPYTLSCMATYWQGGNSCGLNGDQCRPFTNATMPFRCPADCQKSHLTNPHAVGDQELQWRSLIVGGPSKETTGFEDKIVQNSVYRGDSWICPSAVHAGFLKKTSGGCGVLTMTGELSSFSGSTRNGFESAGFDSYFPLSFGFLEGTATECKDLRWPALAVSVFFTALLSVFTTSPSVFFWSIFVGLYFHCALISDPPVMFDEHQLISRALGGFLPACFCAWVTYKYTVKRSLDGLTAQIEKTILWLGPAWVGTLNNYTFDRIPIERLTPHDIKAQPGAVPALIIIVLSIICIALGQAWSFRLEGRMRRYLAIYGLMVLFLIVCLIAPGLNLRIHHYILALLFLPGTSFQNRPSLIYQGLLTGLFINGIARWGFAPILETPGSLLAGFQRDTLLPAVSVQATQPRNITFDLGPLPMYDQKYDSTYDGISILVNDVERFRGYSDDKSRWGRDYRAGGNFTWTWTRHESNTEGNKQGPSTTPISDELASTLPEYFRFGYLAGNQVAEFTRAGTWHRDGSWEQMEDGPS